MCVGGGSQLVYMYFFSCRRAAFFLIFFVYIDNNNIYYCILLFLSYCVIYLIYLILFNFDFRLGFRGFWAIKILCMCFLCFALFLGGNVML